MKTALPAASSVTVPSELAPSMMMTWPDGMPAPGATAPTWMVKVMARWATPLTGLAVIVVAVCVPFTV